jgi:hypothetical protein
MYKLNKIPTNRLVTAIGSVIRTTDGACIPFDPANTDYANFKTQINADEAQLENADGDLMTAEQAKEYVATLP